jgi:hypothetical protein
MLTSEDDLVKGSKLVAFASYAKKETNVDTIVSILFDLC